MEGVLGFDFLSSLRFSNLIFVLLTFYSRNVVSDPSCRVTTELTSISSITNNAEMEVVCFRNPMDSQTITSLNYGTKDYPNNYNRAYVIMGLKGKFIQLQSLDFQLQSSDSESKCRGDSVAIWDLKYPEYIMGKFCGNAVINLTSYTDTLIVLFSTDGSETRKGFQLLATVADCGTGDLRCPSDTTICVPGDKICDGNQDCPQGEDEICTTVCGVPKVQAFSAVGTRVYGGTEAVENSWPWQVLLRMWTNRDSSVFSMCGGSIIAPQWVMTAGHCCVEKGVTVPATSYDVVVGIHDRFKPADPSQVRKVIKVIPHPQYANPFSADFRFVNYDYCLLKVAEPIKFTDTVSPICLPLLPMTPPGTLCYATGWGGSTKDLGIKGATTQQSVLAASSGGLQQVDLTLMATNQCACPMNKCPKRYGWLTPEMLCATGGEEKDTCKGDSGGPYMCRAPASSPVQWQLVGLTSFGIGCASGFPGVYANMRRALPFLVKIVYEHNRDGWLMDTTVPLYDPSVSYKPDDYKVQFENRDLNAKTSASLLTVNIFLLCFFLVASCRSSW